MGKKKVKCPPPGAPAWMATYGDMMTLLLTFFVLLLSFSSMQEAKFYRAIGALQGALGVLAHEQSSFQPISIPMPQLTNLKESEISEAMAELQEITTDMELSESIQLEILQTGMRITISDTLAFPPGSAHLRPLIYPILHKIADLVRGWPNDIRIVGHTDDSPIDTEEFPSNWELSTDRALSILHYFEDEEGGNLQGNRLQAIGRGEFEPKVPNTSRANRAKNRRVEIYIDFDPENPSPSVLEIEKVKEQAAR